MQDQDTTNETPEGRAPEPEEAPAPAPRARKKAEKKKAPKKKTSRKKAGSPAKLAVLDAAAVFAAKDIKEEEIEIEAWGGTIIVRGLKSIDHERLTNSCTEGPIGAKNFNMVGYQAKVAILCSYDGFTKDGGKRIFDKKHLPELMEKASGAVSMIANKAHELSGIGKGAIDEKKALLTKTPSADSLFD